VKRARVSSGTPTRRWPATREPSGSATACWCRARRRPAPPARWPWANAAAQARFVLDRVEGALTELGATLRDVVRTRIFVQRIEDWQAVARVHGERFGRVRPANTLVQATLVHPDLLVEIEAQAVIGAGDAL